jgi:hypothetical protein
MGDIGLALLHKGRFLKTGLAEDAKAALQCHQAEKLKTGTVFSGILDPHLLSEAAKADWRSKWNVLCSEPVLTMTDAEVDDALAVDRSCIEFLMDQPIAETVKDSLEMTLQGLQTSVPRELEGLRG